jgi:hypothetical protein
MAEKVINLSLVDLAKLFDAIDKWYDCPIY